MLNKNFSLLYYQTLKEVFWPLGEDKFNNDNNCQKNFSPIYYQTLEDVMWLLRLDKPKK